MGDVRAPAAVCLSDAQIASLAAGMPGKVDAAIARHLAACPRCQERALFGVRPPRRSAPPPSLQRAFVLVGAVLAALALFFYSVLKLAGFVG